MQPPERPKHPRLDLPLDWDVGEGKMRERIAEFRKVEAKFSSAVESSLKVNREATVDMEVRYKPVSSLAFRRLKSVFLIIAFTLLLRKQAWQTQKAQAIIKTTELEDALEVYVPISATWLQRLFMNYLRSVQEESKKENFSFDMESKDIPDQEAVFMSFLRFKVFLNMLVSKEFYPVSLAAFWGKLSDRRLYLPTSYLTSKETLYLPEPDNFGSREIGTLSQQHQGLVAGVIIYRALLQKTLFPRIASYLAKRTFGGSDSALRAAQHLQLIATALYLAYVDEFVPNKSSTNQSSQQLASNQPDIYPPVLIEEQSARLFFRKIDPEFISNLRFNLRDFINDIMLYTPKTEKDEEMASTEAEDAAKEDTGPMEWVVFHSEGAEVFKEPSGFARPTGKLECGYVFQSIPEKKLPNHEWLRRVTGGWVHAKSGRDGSMTVAKVLKVDNWIQPWLTKTTHPRQNNKSNANKLKEVLDSARQYSSSRLSSVGGGDYNPDTRRDMKSQQFKSQPAQTKMGGSGLVPKTMTKSNGLVPPIRLLPVVHEDLEVSSNIPGSVYESPDETPNHTARPGVAEQATQFFIVLNDNTEIYSGPLISKTARVSYLPKRSVLEIQRCVSVDHSTLFGIKFYQLITGEWIADKKAPKGNLQIALLPTIARHLDGSPCKVVAPNDITPWSFPNWKSTKFPQTMAIHKDAMVLVDVILSNPVEGEEAYKDKPAPVWARLTKTSVTASERWLPVVHPELGGPPVLQIPTPGLRL